jgi:hypothetical protein
MRIITRFLTWLLDLSESKIIARNLMLNGALGQRNADLNNMRQLVADLSQELTTLRASARKSDTTTIVSSDNVRAMQDKFNQLKRHGRALRYSIGQACKEIEIVMGVLRNEEIYRGIHITEAQSYKLREIVRQMRSLGCIPPDAGSIPVKPEDFISDFHPSMLEDNPVDAFKPAKEIVGGTVMLNSAGGLDFEQYGKPGHVVASEAEGEKLRSAAAMLDANPVPSREIVGKERTATEIVLARQGTKADSSNDFVRTLIDRTNAVLDKHGIKRSGS